MDGTSTYFNSTEDVVEFPLGNLGYIFIMYVYFCYRNMFHFLWRFFFFVVYHFSPHLVIGTCRFVYLSKSGFGTVSRPFSLLSLYVKCSIMYVCMYMIRVCDAIQFNTDHHIVKSSESTEMHRSDSDI